MSTPIDHGVDFERALERLQAEAGWWASHKRGTDIR